ncbi:hypothetical protein LXL04_028114 [Taraxacum kok-saghyz]
MLQAKRLDPTSGIRAKVAGSILSGSNF